MTTVVQQQQRQPRRRRSVLQRILGDDTLSIVKRQTAKVELALLQRTEDDATLRSVGSGGQEAAAVIVAASSSPKGGTVVAQTKESYEQNIRRNQERARREQEIYEIETKLRSARLMSKKKRKSLELQMEEAKEAVRRLSQSSFGGGGGVGNGSGLPTRRISNTEMEFNDNDIDPSMTLEEIEAEKAKIKAQIDALTSFAGGGILGGLGGGGTMRPRRRISITESTMVIETVMDNPTNNHQTKHKGICADAADDAAGPDASKRSNNAGESCISSSNNFESSCHSQTFFLDDLPGEDDEPTTQEEKDLKDAMDAIVMARLKAGRPLRRSSSTELSMMSETEEPWMEEEEGGAVDDADTTALASMAMFDFYKPRGSSGSSANNDNAKQRSSDAGGTSATSFFMNESESSTTDCDLLDDGPYSNRRPSYRSDISEIDIPWEGSSGKPQSDMPIRSTTKSILKRAPYRPERRGSGIHSDEFEQWWNPKVSALSRKLYILQQEAEAREESLKVISAEMVTKKDKNEEQIHKLMGHIRKLHKDSQETPMQLKYWQEKATDLSKKVYDLELLLEEQDDTINELLEFKEIQSERITTLEEEILQNRLDTFGSMVDEDGRRPQKKRLSRRASVDMTMQKSLRRASSCQSMDEQVKEEAKLEIIALESRLAKVNEEQVQLQRELDTMRALLESTTQQQEPTYEEKLIVEEKKVVRERLIYQLSCRQCKGKDLNFVGTTMLDIIDQVDVHFQEVVQQVQKMNGKGRRSDDVFTEGTNSTKWSATFAQHFAKHCRKKCKCADDVIKYCRKNVKIEILKKENGAELYWNDYEE